MAVALAILSSLQHQALPEDLVAFGELGLTGEIRPIQNGIERLRSAKKHGFSQVIVPAANANQAEHLDLTLHHAHTVIDIVDTLKKLR